MKYNTLFRRIVEFVGREQLKKIPTVSLRSILYDAVGGSIRWSFFPRTKLEIKRSHAWTDAGEFLETTFPGVVRAEISTNAKYFSHIKCIGRIKQRTCPRRVQGTRRNAGLSAVFHSEFPVARDF